VESPKSDNGTTDENELDEPQQPALAEDVVMQVEILDAQAGHPRVTGQTNLPTGTVLSVEVMSKAKGVFSGQDETHVQDGRYEAGPFGPAEGLPMGRYVADVLMPYPAMQSDPVKAVIGDQGEHLKGKLVESDEDSRWVENKASFVVGDAIEAKRADIRKGKAVKSEARSILAALRRLEKQGRSMEPLRATSSHAKLSKCGGLMRERQKVAQGLRERSDELPMRLRIHLGPAAGHGDMCVSCLTWAMEQCDLMREALRGAEAELRSW
jgi:hypothetical protein